VLAFNHDIEQCLRVLEAGGLILYPTDTIWGIGCDATNEEAVARIYKLKKRPDEKSMIVLLAEEKDILNHVSQAHPRVFDYIKGVKKPTTFIYEGGTGLARNLVSQDGTVAIRVTSDPFCNQLISRFGKPLVSTSANISGYPPPTVFGDIDSAIKDGVDYVVQHRQEDTTPAFPSSIIKWNKDGTVTVIRK
jgi:L-threonylcarbamoyladenylate synthase